MKSLEAQNFADQFGSNLAYCRRRAGISQEELAVLASVHRTEISHLERGLRIARVDTVVKLAGSLGIAPGELLDGLGWEPGSALIGKFVGGGREPRDATG